MRSLEKRGGKGEGRGRGEGDLKQTCKENIRMHVSILLSNSLHMNNSETSFHICNILYICTYMQTFL